jgi:WD40 repeat protein
MQPGLADRLSRALVSCHPRRWRERYLEEMLDVLDQHHPTGRTVASLAVSVLSTHLDPAYRTAGPSRSQLRRAVGWAAAITAPLALVSGCLGYAAWSERWQLSGAGGVGSVAFGPGQRLLVTGVGGPGENNMVTVWDFADRARPRQLSAFRGGQPTALSPDGLLVVTPAPDDEPALWNIANPRQPVRIAVMPALGRQPLWGEAFSPDGQVFAAAYLDQIFLWDVANPARPALLGTMAAQAVQANDAASITPQDIAFSPDGRFLASVTGTDHVTVWNVTDPARAVRIATLASSRDMVQTLAFSSDGNLLAGVTYYGTVLVFSLADPARPALTTTISTIMPHALWPDGLLKHPDAPPCPPCSPAAYAVAFTPDGHTLTVLVDREESSVSGDPAVTMWSRDTIFTWNVASSGALSGLTTAFRKVVDNYPALAPDGRTVADGSPDSNAVYLWTPP